MPPPSPQPSPSHRYNVLVSPRDKGTLVHRKRKEQLADQEYDFERIPTTTTEGRFIKNLLVLYWTLKDFNDGQRHIARELPIYGRLGYAVLSGYIDEIRINRRTNKIIISELKTREDESPTRVKNLNDNRLQVSLYACLLTNLKDIDPQLVCAKGSTKPIDGDVPIREDFLSHCPDGVETPIDLLNTIKRLPRIYRSFIEVEYVYAFFNDDGEISEEPINKEKVHYDESLLLSIIEECLPTLPNISSSVVRNLSAEF